MSGVTRDFAITNQLGLHARASATLVRVASKFESEVTVAKDGHGVNGKSILGMMTLAAAMGSTVQVTCEGPDQDEAIDAIGECISNKFGEE